MNAAVTLAIQHHVSTPDVAAIVAEMLNPGERAVILEADERGERESVALALRLLAGRLRRQQEFIEKMGSH